MPYTRRGGWGWGWGWGGWGGGRRGVRHKNKSAQELTLRDRKTAHQGIEPMVSGFEFRRTKLHPLLILAAAAAAAAAVAAIGVLLLC